MTNPYVTYYVSQVGSGISHYHGTKYQRGGGFFGTLWQKALLPFLKTAGRETVRTGLGVAEDFALGKDLKESARTRFSKAGRQLGSKVLKQGQDYLDQAGEGRKKRRKAPGAASYKETKAGRSKSVDLQTLTAAGGRQRGRPVKETAEKAAKKPAKKQPKKSPKKPSKKPTKAEIKAGLKGKSRKSNFLSFENVAYP